MQQQIQQANKLFQNRQFQAVIDYLQDLPVEQSPDLLNMLSISLFRTGEKQAGLKLMQNAVRNHPGLPALINNYGNLLYENGELRESVSQYEQVLDLHPSYHDAMVNLGNALYDLEEYTRALEYYLRARQIQGDSAKLCHVTGRCYLALNQTAQANTVLQKGLGLAPEHTPILNELGRLFFDQFEKAKTYYQRALRVDALNPETLNNFGNLYRKQHQFDMAIEMLDQLCKTDTLMAEPYNNLGLCYSDTGDFDKAIDCFHQAIRKRPEYAMAEVGLGLAYLKKRDLELARTHLKRAVALAPDNATSNYNLGVLYLLQEDYAQGWPLYEWRKFLPEYHSIHGRELINGTIPLEGKTVHVYAEQGLGDTIQFCRYLPELGKRCLAIHFSCHPDISPLLRQFTEIDSMLRLENSPDCDLSLSLVSLPLALGLEGPPSSCHPPYLRCANESLLTHWEERLGEHLLPRVGLVWGGNPMFYDDWLRSPGLASYLPLLDIPGLRFFSLQCGEAAKQLLTIPDSIPAVADLHDALSDFEQTAAAMRCLDLLISSDTSTLHLAGALGIPAWGILHYNADWRWGLDTDSTPWYPELRLYRQRTWGKWEECIARVRNDLLHFSTQ